MYGRFIGHRLDGKPLLINQFESEVDMPSFDCLRLEQPLSRMGPMWEDLSKAGAVYKAEPQEAAAFNEILQQLTPPGPKYYELITEIWHRGYEVFLVGGTVRDIVAGQPSKDVDLVTSMPIVKALPFLSSMYGYYSKPALQEGYIRLGGDPTKGDPFIDLKVFCVADLGLPSAKFGADFTIDVAHRDFACNSVFYEPVNNLLIDPTGRGLSDAENRVLSFACDKERHRNQNIEKIFIRFFKFRARGFTHTEECFTTLHDDFLPHVGSLNRFDRLKYVRTQVLGKTPLPERPQAMAAFKEAMLSCGFANTWARYFDELASEILGA